MHQPTPGSDATVANLITQMSRGASVLNGWDAVLNIDEDLVNQIFQTQFMQSAQDSWKSITIAFCQTFPNPEGSGLLAAYTRINITLATPSLTFLGDNQAFVRVSFSATGRTGTATRVVPSSFDSQKDSDPDDPSLQWTYTSFSNTSFVGQVPLSSVTGSEQSSGEMTEFVIDFPAGSFTSPLFDKVQNSTELHLQLKNYLQTHNVQYVVCGIKTGLKSQFPQMEPKAFRLAVLTTNEKRNVFQIFIATQNPVQRNLTIGVNEPIPNGYSLSAMFNQSIVGQLQTSLTLQVWLFMQSYLLFPGRTDLSLGPSFTPGDALILGALAIDTSMVLVPPPHPSQERTVLNIQNTKQITPPGQPAFTAYGDDADPHAWYIPPKVVWAMNAASNLPQFSMIKYDLTGGGVSGFCRFSVQLMIDPVQSAALQTAVPGAVTPQFDWAQSGAIFTYTIAGKSTSILGQPSNFGSQIVTFSVPLEDEVAIAAFVNAFSPRGSGGGTFGVSYALTASTRLPAVTVVTTFNAAIAYQYQVQNKYAAETRYHTDTWGHTEAHQVQVYVGTFVKEMLQQTQAATVTVTPGQGLTPTMLTMVTDWAHVQLQKDVEQAINTALALMHNHTNNFSMNSVTGFTHTLEATNVVPWYFTVDGTLPTFDAATWNKVYSEVNQQQLQVTFEIQADLTALAIERVNLTFQYGDPPPLTHTFEAGHQSSWFVTLPGRFDGTRFIADYKYKYDVIYAAPDGGGTPPPLSTDWIADNSTTIKFGVVQLGLLPVTFQATNIGWKQGPQQVDAMPSVQEITVDWNWIPGEGGPVLTESVLLNSEKTTVTSTLRSSGPTSNQDYQYSLTFLMSDGTKLHATGLTGTSPLQRIDDPLSQVSINVFPDYPTDAKAVILLATFDDQKNNIHLSKRWMARATVGQNGGSPTLNTDTFASWDFQAVVANLNMTTVVFSGTWIDSKSVQHQIPKTLVLGNNGTLVISNTQRTVTAVVDASNVAFVPPQTNGVYRVVALVTDSEKTPVADSDTLASASTITFGHDTPAIQYYQTPPIDIAATATFHYQYIYTVNQNNGAQTSVTNAWTNPQSTVSTSLPVVPGEPPTAPQATPRVMFSALGETALDKRTSALFARHASFCESCEVDLKTFLAK